MRFAYFAHSWFSDWNHGNAHFLRGLAAALQCGGHSIRLYEPIPGPGGGWSLSHLLEEPGGEAAVLQARQALADLDIKLYSPPERTPSPAPPALAGIPWVNDWQVELRGAEFVLVHEWNPPELVHWLVGQRRRHGFRLLLHDTHHRACSDPGVLDRLPLHALDAVVAFGESLRRSYERHGAATRTYTLHEAADTLHFRPLAVAPDCDVVWIGNWGDEERSRELDEFLLAPVAATHARTRVYGVRYPPRAQAQLRQAGIGCGGYLPNLEAPHAYARAAATIHVPRAPYVTHLPGIPTIRMFEALACGIPLLSAPWSDSESLFTAGEDYWLGQNRREMTALLVQLLTHPEQRIQLSRHAVATIRARHTCAHRALHLEAICRDLG